MKNLFTTLMLIVIGTFSLYLKAACSDPTNLQVSSNGGTVIFSWTSPSNSDVHAILVKNMATGIEVKGFTSVASTWTTTALSPGTYGWRLIAICDVDSGGSVFAHSNWVEGGQFTVGTEPCSPQPSVAQAGADQLNISGTSTSLAATVPSAGTGAWSLQSGTGGNIGDAGSVSSTFTGVAGTSYVLRWTVSNSCGNSYDEVTVSFEESIPTSVTDIDGNTYSVVKIGSQIWMAENLRVSRYNDGTTIPNVTDNTAWSQLTTGAWSYYNNDASYNYPYGKLYNWYAVNTGKLCPQGWHIPTDAEWTQLDIYLGRNAGLKMKSTGNSTDGTGLWIKFSGYEGTNESGFSGLPGGYRSSTGTYVNMGNYGYWWSSTEPNTYYAWSRYLYYGNGFVTRDYYNKERGLSCRCVRD